MESVSNIGIKNNATLIVHKKTASPYKYDINLGFPNYGVPEKVTKIDMIFNPYADLKPTRMTSTDISKLIERINYGEQYEEIAIMTYNKLFSKDDEKTDIEKIREKSDKIKEIIL